MLKGYIRRLDKYILKRRYKDIPNDRLRQDWLAAFQSAATDPCDRDARANLNDLTSEFHFRGRVLPFCWVKREAYEYIRAVDEALDALRTEYPEGRSAAMRDLQFVIDAGLVDGEKNHPVWSETRDVPMHKYFPRSVFCE
jgi:hypothetical protein